MNPVEADTDNALVAELLSDGDESDKFIWNLLLQDDDDLEDDGEDGIQGHLKRQLAQLHRTKYISVCYMMFCQFIEDLPQCLNRQGNLHRSRPHSLAHIHNWDDVMFERQLRLSREDFYSILVRISPHTQRNEVMAVRSKLWFFDFSGAEIGYHLPYSCRCIILGYGLVRCACELCYDDCL